MLSSAEIRTLKVCRQLVGSLGNTPLRASLDAMIDRHEPDAAILAWCKDSANLRANDRFEATHAQPHRFTEPPLSVELPEMRYEVTPSGRIAMSLSELGIEGQDDTDSGPIA
jgi:hypothetical protein